LGEPPPFSFSLPESPQATLPMPSSAMSVSSLDASFVIDGLHGDESVAEGRCLAELDWFKKSPSFQQDTKFEAAPERVR
jgi:hypothetical protein